ncbi:MAG: beta-galactosidase trimerization domain-containing protein [Planctomycetota bacterium]
MKTPKDQIFMRMKRFLLAALFLATLHALAQDDAYEKYVKTSVDFKRVKQDKDWLLKAYPSWQFMPWYFQWTIGHTPESGEFCKASGFNGAFVDRGDTSHLAWIDTYKLRFYMDHTAGKGDLHLWDGSIPKPQLAAVHGTGVRFKPVNAAMKTRLEAIMKKNIDAVKSSPNRSAYALDDEISWGHFAHPTMWNVTDDAKAYDAWLADIYGPNAPKRPAWISYNDILPKLSGWSIASFDASPLMDQWTFNDSYWNNFLGDLVEYSNSVDPATPCGFVGGQSPCAFGGFDYAKQMRKIQYLEAYNMGGSQSIVRSFNPRNAVPAVTSYFHRSTDDGLWQLWYYLAQGNRGEIGWVEKWFNADKTPKDWIKTCAPQFIEAGQKIGPLMSGAEWKHDGVALYYSHASIQLGWIMDAQAHGKTWINRNGDDKLGASHLVRRAWLDMLRDEGIQFNWINYVDVVQNGVPPEYKVLILPATLCLSDIEAKRIREFCANGGTVIADYLPGLWDQHGKGRADGGVLDDLFGVHQSSKLTQKDVFNGARLWCEVDQDANFTYTSFETFLTNKNTCVKDASGFNKAVREMNVGSVNKVGKGSAILLNLSPQWYNAYRVAGTKDAAKRSVFMDPIHSAGVKRWVSIKGASEREFGYEITYWSQGKRTILFVVANLAMSGSELGGGNAVGLKSERLPITLEFASALQNVKDERSGKSLGNGTEFKLDWKQNEACVLSFDTP